MSAYRVQVKTMSKRWANWSQLTTKKEAMLELKQMKALKIECRIKVKQ